MNKRSFKIGIMAILVHALLLLEAQAQEVAIKTNALYLLTGTMNIGGELVTGEQTSLSLQVQYHPWEWGNNKKMKHIWVQPEYRYWWKGVFTGSFMGIHLNWANYNIAKMPPITTLKNHRYQGNAIGCGLTYGYQWLLGTYWNLETSVSAGYLHLHYKRYGPEKNDPMEKESYSNYIGPYQVGVTLTYFLR